MLAGRSLSADFAGDTPHEAAGTAAGFAALWEMQK
jgi:hypothetical protein